VTRGDAAISAAATWSSLSELQVRVAIRYYAEHRDEIDERIRLNREEADRLYASYEREQQALA
jgi:hypothetical protein